MDENEIVKSETSFSELNKSSTQVKDKFDVVIYDNPRLAMDTALNKAYLALRDGGQMIIKNPVETKWTIYKYYALTKFDLISEKKNKVILKRKSK